MATPAAAFAQIATECEAEGLTPKNGEKIGHEIAESLQRAERRSRHHAHRKAEFSLRLSRQTAQYGRDPFEHHKLCSGTLHANEAR